MSQSQNIRNAHAAIPLAREVPEVFAREVPHDTCTNDNQVLNIEKNVIEIKKQLSTLNNGLTGLNLLNVIALQKSVNDLGHQLSLMTSFNKNMGSFNVLVNDLNKLLDPLSKLAKEKLVYSQKEAVIKEKQFMLDLAAVRAKEYGISQWRAYTLLINENTNIYNFVSGLIGMIIGSVSVHLMKSKY